VLYTSLAIPLFFHDGNLYTHSSCGWRRRCSRRRLLSADGRCFSSFSSLFYGYGSLIIESATKFDVPRAANFRSAMKVLFFRSGKKTSRAFMNNRDFLSFFFGDNVEFAVLDRR